MNWYLDAALIRLGDLVIERGLPDKPVKNIQLPGSREKIKWWQTSDVMAIGARRTIRMARSSFPELQRGEGSTPGRKQPEMNKWFSPMVNDVVAEALAIPGAARPNSSAGTIPVLKVNFAMAVSGARMSNHESTNSEPLNPSVYVSA